MPWWVWVLAAALLFWVLDYILDSKKWRKWPTLAEYLTKNPGAKGENGVRCASCGSTNISSHAALKVDERMRLHRCDSCSTWLYRNEI